MVFPATVLGTKVQLKLNNVWTDTVRYDTNTKILQKTGVAITRGASGMQDKTPAGTARWTWQDPNGIYNNENPRSLYYGLMQRNVPVRIYVPRAQKSLYVVSRYGNAGADAVRCSCPDTAALGIVGDISVRIDLEPKRWTRFGVRNTSTVTNGFMPIISKYGIAGQRCWQIRLREDGTITFAWSVTGSNSFVLTTTGTIDMSKPRLAIRADMDVDNGAAHPQCLFYTAPTMAGPWVLFETVIGTGAATTIFDGTAAIEIGTDFGDSLLNMFTYAGRVYAAEVYNSAGTRVVNADFTAQTAGATSFPDGLGNTFTLGSLAEITDADYRFHGELSAPKLKPNRSKNGAGLDVQIEAEAGGIIRRLTANDAPLQSPLFRWLTANTGRYPSFSPHDLWTGEDASASDVDRASNAITGGAPAVISDITFNGFDATLPGNAGVMVCGTTAPAFVGTCQRATQTTETHFIGLAKFPSLPVAEIVLWQIYTANSTIVRWNFCVSATGYALRGYNAAGTEVATKVTLFGVGAEPTNWIAFHMQLTNAAGTVTILSEWMNMTTGVAYNQNGIGTLTFAGSNGVITAVNVNGTGLSNVRLADILCTTLTVANGMTFWDGANPTFARVANGYKGETADQRFIRICQLLNVTPVIWGAQNDSEQMGSEPIDTGMNILYECIDVSGATMMEAVDQLNTLEFYTLKSTYNQQGALSLTWAQVAQGLEATPDDTDVANDITLQRKNGGSARATLEFGPMSIQAPPTGINPVPDGPEINNFSDSRLPYLVQNMLFIRTWPDSRYPSVVIQLEHPNFTANANLSLQATRHEINMQLLITALPTFMAPEPINLLVKGVKETLLAQEWKREFVCVPYGPYVGSELATISTSPYINYKATHTTLNGVSQQQLNAGITNSATSFAIKTLSGVLFSTAATNIPIMIGGELMTVGSVTGATSPQTMNGVTRGVNGFAAAHFANDQVKVYPTLKARL